MGANISKDDEFKGPIEINNKDIPLLADVLCIMQEVYHTERLQEWEQDRMLNITQHLSGMPGGGGMPKGLDSAFAILSELNMEHEDKCIGYVRKLRKAERILNNIESQSMRTFVLMKYVFDAPDTDIRKELNMSRRGFDRARKAIEEAPRMASVKWQEKYIISEEKLKI